MKQIVLLALLMLLALTGYAQNSDKSKSKTPDFTGTWVLDKKKSGLEGGMVIGQMLVDIKLVIEHNEPEMKIVQTIQGSDGIERVSNITVFTDGRRKPFKGKNDANNHIEYSWKDDTLVKTAKFVISKGEGWDWFLEKNKKDSIPIENREEWKLSKNGKTLTQRLNGGTAPGALPFPTSFKYVFRRQN